MATMLSRSSRSFLGTLYQIGFMISFLGACDKLYDYWKGKNDGRKNAANWVSRTICISHVINLYDEAIAAQRARIAAELDAVAAARENVIDNNRIFRWEGYYTICTWKLSGIVDNNLIVDNDHIIDNNLILGEGDIIPPAQASFEALMAKPHASRSHKSRELLMTTIFRRWYEFRTCYINRVG